MAEAIKFFRGEYDFLSNFYEAEITYDGITYKNSEAAFQAGKCLDYNERLKFAELNPSAAKRLGRRVALRPDWEDVKYGVMQAVVKAKFEQNEDLAEKLLATGDAHLEEGNTWNDRTWGVCRGVGKNWLGVILMGVREELRDRKS